MNQAMWPPVGFLGAIALVTAWIAYTPGDAGRDNPLPRAPETIPAEPPAEESNDLDALVWGRLRGARTEAGPTALPPAPSEPVSAGNADAARVVIGDAIDPEDADAWALAQGDRETVTLGDFLDADDPDNWTSAPGVETIRVGDYQDPDDPSTWSLAPLSEAINIGPYYDPEQPDTWPRDGVSESLSIGEDIPVPVEER